MAFGTFWRTYSSIDNFFIKIKLNYLNVIVWPIRILSATEALVFVTATQAKSPILTRCVN